MAGRGRGIGLEKLGISPALQGIRGRGRGFVGLLPSIPPSPVLRFGAGRGVSASALPSAGGTTSQRGATRDQRPISIYRTRPASADESKEGTSGTLVTLNANYFRLIQQPEFEFCLYRVDFEPNTDLDMLRKAIVRSHKETLGGYLFDGKSLIYLTRSLPQDEMELEFESREGEIFIMKLKNTHTTIRMTDNMGTQVLNLILRRAMDGLKMQLVGRNMYDPDSKVELKMHKLELWPGYISSIRQHEENVLVCCEVSHKVMRQETIYDIMANLQREDSANWQDNFKKEIIGSIVLTDYNNKTYRIDDVDFTASPMSTFTMKDREVTYKEYYQTKYSRDINDPKQPMLVSNPKPRDIRDGRTQVLFLVPELSRATGLTDKMRANFQLMKAMADHTQMDPTNRKNRLLQFTERLHKSEESVQQLAAFNTDIDNQLVTLTGRALPQETMLFGSNKTTKNDDRVDWTNGMKMNEMFATVPLKRWFFLYPKRSSVQAETFLQLLQEVARGMKYEMSEPRKVELGDDRLPSYISAVQNAMTQDPTLIMIILPNNSADRYAAIKRLTCVGRAIPTQMIVHKTMCGKNGVMAGVKSIATKVVVQVNCKLGGAAWSINFPIKGVMTIGFDVTHDTRDRNKSFGAFVASMDLKQKIEYYSSVSHHSDGNEMSKNIEIHLIQALNAYRSTHGYLPERIFFYRDGVGDGQVEQIHSQEVVKLNAKLKQYYENLETVLPKFVFIVVNKRINTRIFLTQGSRVVNPASGTVVDNTITLPERYDFFLVSQSVRQGTVSPTSYNVIYDTSGMTPDKLQMLTYKLTHLYYNWSGTVRVPGVVQYAHKLALLVGEHLHQTPSESFFNKLYFL